MVFERVDQLLKTEQKISDVAIRQLDNLENRLGCLLPSAVRNWYSRADALEVLTRHSNGDRPIPLHEFKWEEWEANKLLPFKLENQGVCCWAVLLDGSDDPPVYVRVEESDWVTHSNTFSDHVYACVWDYTMVLAQPELQAQHRFISPQTVETLTTYLTEDIRTYGWPGHTQYRFSGDHQTILIWSTEHQADWFIAADNIDTLHSLLKLIWHLDGIGSSLYECSDMGRTALQTFTAQVSKEATS